MPQSRRLAAILFTDIEGFSAMMQQDELKAINVKNQHRQVVDQYHGDFNGNIIQYFGDGTLSIFHSAVEAVQCALEMQLTFQKLQVPVRMGLHMGDVVFDNESIFGDGVNIASRIESLGVAGSVLLSDRVEAEIHNHHGLETVSAGSYQFKNIKQRVEVFALSHEGLVKPPPYSLKGKIEESGHFSKRKLKKSSEKSIAVLPFENMSNDPEQEYFSDGVAEEIINSLAHVDSLKVAGRMSSFQFKGAKADIREIGEKLGVNNIMEGSIRKQGDKLRVTVQLINVEDGFHVWSEKYDRKMDDIFAIQDEIALAITEKLKVTLLKKDYDKITKVHTLNPDAYEAYLKGRFLLNRRGPSIVTAIQYFRQAIELDPEFASAYAGLADAHLLLATYGLVSPKQVMVTAKNACERALQLDPALFEPYCSLGYYYTTFELNWAEAKKNYLKSLEINPHYCQAHSWYGWNYLTWVEGKFEEAEKHGEILIKVEPLSATYYGSYSLILHTAGKYEKALAICQMGIELDATAFLCRLNEGHIYLSMKQYENALASFEAAISISKRHHFAVNGLIWAYCFMGNYEQANSLMNELKERAQKEYIACMFTGLSAAYLGNIDEAFDYLEKALDEREPVILAIKYEKSWGPPALRSDPRFQALIDRIGYPDDSGMLGL